MTAAPPRPAEQRKADTITALATPGIDVWVATAGVGGAHLVPLSLAWIDEQVVVALPADSITTRNLTTTGTARLAVGPTRDVVMIDSVLEEVIAVEEAPADVIDGYSRAGRLGPALGRRGLRAGAAATGADPGMEGGQRDRRPHADARRRVDRVTVLAGGPVSIGNNPAMARVPYPDPTTLSPDTQELLGKLPPLNIFRMLAGGDDLLRAFVRFGNHLLSKASLDPVLREIAIVRVGVLSGASYEVHQHETISRQLGMSDELIAAIRNGPEDPAFDKLQRQVMRFTDDIVANVSASDDTFDALESQLSLQQLQELTITIGFYMAVSRYLETFGIEIEDAG